MLLILLSLANADAQQKKYKKQPSEMAVSGVQKQYFNV